MGLDLVVIWGHHDPPCVVVSALGSERLGVQIGQDDHWEPRRNPRKIRSKVRQSDDPDDERTGRERGALPDPWLLLGSGFVGWRPGLELSAPCAICGGMRMGRFTVCLACLKSGQDPYLPNVPLNQRPRKVYDPSPNGCLTGGVGAATPGRPRKAGKLGSMPHARSGHTGYGRSRRNRVRG